MAQRGLHMQLPVVLAEATTNFIKLPKAFAQSVRSAFAASAHGVVAFRLGWLAPPDPASGGLARPMQAFVGWSDGVSEGHYIQVPVSLADSLGLKTAVEFAHAMSPDSPLILSVAVIPFAPVAARVDIDPVTPDDWEILQLNANFVEEELLNQICVLGQEQRFPVWIHGRTRINMKVSKIELVERGQALCVRLARNTEVVVAPKLRAKEDLLRAQSLRQKEQDATKLATPYELRVQSSSLRLYRTGGDDLFPSAPDMWNCICVVNPVTLSKMSKVATWPKTKVLTDGSVVFSEDPSKPVIVIVCNRKRFAIIDHYRKQKKGSQKKPAQISSQHITGISTSSTSNGSNLTHSGPGQTSFQLCSTANRTFLRLKISDQAAPGHIILSSGVLAQCKLAPLEKAVVALPRFEPIVCPTSFPALCVHLTLVMGQEEVNFADALPDGQFASDVVLAAQAWQRQQQLKGSKTPSSVPIYDGCILSFPVRYGNGVTHKISRPGEDATLNFVVRIVDDGSALDPENTSGELKKQQPQRVSPFKSIEPVHWILSGESKIEWKIDKFIVDPNLQKIQSGFLSLEGSNSMTSSSSVAGVEDGKALGEYAGSSKGKARLKNLVIHGMSSIESDFVGDIQMEDLGAFDSYRSAALDKLYPVLNRITATNRVCVGAPHPGGLYVCGGRGYGKSALALGVASELRQDSKCLTNTVWIACASLRGGKRSEIESAISSAFKEALSNAPSLLVFDDLDLLLPAPPGGSDEGSGGGNEDSQAVWLAEWIEDLIHDYQRKLDSFEAVERELLIKTGENGNSMKRAISWIATGREKGSLRKSLVRPGLFDKTLQLQPLTAHDRTTVMESLLRNRSKKDGTSSTLIEESLDIEEIAAKTEGYAPADLEMLTERAMHCSLARVVKQSTQRLVTNQLNGGDYTLSDSNPEDCDDDEQNLEGTGSSTTLEDSPVMKLIQEDFTNAIEGYTPAALRGVALAKSDVKWSDVGGLHQIRQTLKETLELPIQFAALYERSPQRLASGILLYGPPGCGKTLLAGAVAKECGLNFISVKGPEVLNKYIGASEQAVRDLFARGAAASPCIVFFDEFDAIAPRRGNDSSGVTDRVVNQLLTFLDGVESRSGVYVMAATSRPDLVDPALLRPGRLDKQLLCGFPNAEEREDILRTIATKMGLSEESQSELPAIARMPKVELFTGADLQAILYTAQLSAVHEGIPASIHDGVTDESDLPLTATTEEASNELHHTDSFKPVVTGAHLHQALEEARPSVSREDRDRFNRIYEAFKGDRGADFNAVSGYPDGRQRTALK